MITFQKQRPLQEWIKEQEDGQCDSRIYSTWVEKKNGDVIYLNSSLLVCAVLNREYDLVDQILKNPFVDRSGYTQELLYLFSYPLERETGVAAVNNHFRRFYERQARIQRRDGIVKIDFVNTLLAALLVEDKKLIHKFIDLGVDNMSIVETVYSKYISSKILSFYKRIVTA